MVRLGAGGRKSLPFYACLLPSTHRKRRLLQGFRSVTRPRIGFLPSSGSKPRKKPKVFPSFFFRALEKTRLLSKFSFRGLENESVFTQFFFRGLENMSLSSKFSFRDMEKDKVASQFFRCNRSEKNWFTGVFVFGLPFDSSLAGCNVFSHRNENDWVGLCYCHQPEHISSAGCNVFTHGNENHFMGLRCQYPRSHSSLAGCNVRHQLTDFSLAGCNVFTLQSDISLVGCNGNTGKEHDVLTGFQRSIRKICSRFQDPKQFHPRLASPEGGRKGKIPLSASRSSVQFVFPDTTQRRRLCPLAFHRPNGDR